MEDENKDVVLETPSDQGDENPQEVSKIKLEDGSVYNFKDAFLREEIKKLLG